MSEFVQGYVKTADQILETLSGLEQCLGELDRPVLDPESLSLAEAIVLASLRRAITERIKTHFGPYIVGLSADTTSEVEQLKQPDLGNGSKPPRNPTDMPNTYYSSNGKTSLVTSREPRPREEDGRSLYEMLSEKIIPVTSEATIGSSPKISIIADDLVRVHGEQPLEYRLRPEGILALNMILDSRDGVSLTDMVIRLGLDSRTPPEQRERLKSGMTAVRTMLGPYLKRDGQTSNTSYQLPPEVVIADLRVPQTSDGVKKN
jgi:hypothetical protein